MGCALRVESCELGVSPERTTRNSQLFQLACFSRLRLLRHRLQSVDKLEGEAPAEPKLSASREVGKSADWERFGLTYRFALPATE